MALNGRLEDLDLLEILQIIAFSKKTGTLKVESTLASGAVLFQDGVVLCAFSTSTTPVVSPLAGMTLNESRALLLQDEIRIALRELVALREGQFEFSLTCEPPTHFEGMDISRFIVAGGVDPQALMLELARDLDTARKDSTFLLESTEEMAKHIEREQNGGRMPQLLERPEINVLLVDDEPKVLDIRRYRAQTVRLLRDHGKLGRRSARAAQKPSFGNHRRPRDGCRDAELGR